MAKTAAKNLGQCGVFGIIRATTYVDLEDKQIVMGEKDRGRAPLSAWELPSLLTPMHQHKRAAVENPRMRPHYTAIVGFVYRNRFAIAEQIRRRFAESMKSSRTARRHLGEIEALGLLGVMPTRGTSPLFPKVFFVTPRGARMLKDHLGSKGVRRHIVTTDRFRRNGLSCDHLIHEIQITEFLLQVWESCRASGQWDLATIERRSIPSQPALRVVMRGNLSRLEPDAMFVFRQKKKGLMCCFVEIDTGSMTERQLNAKFRRYESWSQSQPAQSFLRNLYEQHGAMNPRATFRLMTIVTGGDETGKRCAKIRRAATSFKNVNKRLWITSASKLQDVSKFRVLETKAWLDIQR